MPPMSTLFLPSLQLLCVCVCVCGERVEKTCRKEVLREWRVWTVGLWRVERTCEEV